LKIPTDTFALEGKIVRRLLLLVLVLGLKVAPAQTQTLAQTQLATVRIGSSASHNVPAAFEQGSFVAPQAATAVDITADGKWIGITTTAFRHDRNFWLLSEDGEIQWGRYLLPWAPFQVGVGEKANDFAVGLAYSRITPPYPTLSLFRGERDEDIGLADSMGETGWLRYGSGNWRTGWVTSVIGDLLVRAGKSVITIHAADILASLAESKVNTNSSGGAWRLAADGTREKYPLGARRPFRMAASTDGAVLGLGYIATDPSRLYGETKPALREAVSVLSVVSAGSAKELWSVMPLWDAPDPARLPDPTEEYPEMGRKYRLGPDAILPFRVAMSVALSSDGSRVAATEYGGWMWVRRKPVIGTWDPPYHVIPFVPRQQGWLRIFDGTGAETAKAKLPAEGLFEVRMSGQGDRIWCIPASWFARGLAGSPWRPADDDANTLFVYEVARQAWTAAWRLPDAVADLAPHPGGDQALVSSWDGWIYLVGSDGKVQRKVRTGSPARLRWSTDGRRAVAATESGKILLLDAGAKLQRIVSLPVAPPPSLTEPLKPLVDGVPVYYVGFQRALDEGVRITSVQPAYAGSIWLVKTGEGGFLVDGGGAGKIPTTIAMIKAAGLEINQVHYLLQSHSHGDHVGAAYLWRTLGLKIVAPDIFALTTGWLMPTLTDYAVWVPRPVDVPLLFKRIGDETELDLGGVHVKAIFVPGHSFDSTIYLMELNQKRIAFTGDIGYYDFLGQTWNDVENTREVMEVVRTKVIPWHPDVVFTGHTVQTALPCHPDVTWMVHTGQPGGTEFLQGLVDATLRKIAEVESK
jgi:glyoxylase-like metal-dependent hydrolase (beta-lactamase superfamily II)